MQPATFAGVAMGHALSLMLLAGSLGTGRGSRRRSAAGWSSLTATEAKVVTLVSEGLRNAEVAAQLFMTVATVKTHLGHVFAKLGVASRAELAAVVHNRP